MWRKEFIGKNFWKHFLVLNIGILIIFFLFGTFLPLIEIFYGSGELVLFMFVASLTTVYYKKYNNDFFLKRMKIVKMSKWKIKINSFLLVFYYGILTILLILLWAFLLQPLKLFQSTIFIDSRVDNFNWVLFKYVPYFILMTIELLIIISFTYFLLHFFNNEKFVYGIIIIITIYMLFFGNMFFRPLDFVDLSSRGEEFKPNNYYPVWRITQSGNNILFLFLNTIITPWSNYGIFGKVISVHSDYYDSLSIIHWTDFSHSTIIETNPMSALMTNWMNLMLWTPIVFILSYLIIPKLF